MTTAQTSSYDTAILSRLLKPGRADLSPEAAQALLQFDFDQADRERMHELSVKVQEGTLQPAEQQELDSYRRIGYFLDLVRSKARLVLKKHGSGC